MDYFGSFGNSKKEALSKLEPILKAALKSHETGDYEAYSDIITDELKRKLPKENFMKAFEEIAPKLGRLTSMRFLGSLNKDGNPMLVYAARYAETSDDVLITVTFKDGSHPPKIGWLWIE